MKKNNYIEIEINEEAFQKYLKNFIIASLRRVSYRWAFKHMAKNRCRIERGFYKCQSCDNAFGPKEINLDHIQPVIDPFKGFTTWDDYINRLFVKSDGFQVLCLSCHNMKSNIENQMRVKNGQKPIRTKKKVLIKKKKKVKII